mgnify:CR=1 FL=1
MKDETKVTYEHIRLNSRLKPIPVRAITIATVVSPNGKVFTGVAVCGAADQFCKAKGRKTALIRAMNRVKAFEGRVKAKKSPKPAGETKPKE